MTRINASVRLLLIVLSGSVLLYAVFYYALNIESKLHKKAPACFAPVYKNKTTLRLILKVVYRLSLSLDKDFFIEECRVVRRLFPKYEFWINFNIIVFELK